MRVKVTADVTIWNAEDRHGKGKEFVIDESTLPAIKEFVEVLDEAEKAQTEVDEAEESAEELKVSEIKAILDGRGIEYDVRAKKSELIALLEQ